MDTSTLDALDTTYLDSLYTNNTGRKSFQWELWTACNSLCKFCYLGKENRVCNKDRQLKSLEGLLDAIEHLDFTKYNNISIIGGEFFQGQLNDPDVHNKFFDTITQIFKLYQDKKIGSIWITATLTLGDQKHLYELLDLAKEMKIFPVKDYGASGLWICTSCDAEGRFHNNDMRITWDKHMREIAQEYPFVKFNTTIILMEKLLQDYLDGKFRPKQFSEVYHTTLFYKQPGIPNFDWSNITSEAGFYNKWLRCKEEFNKNTGIEFFPRRSTFIKFLRKYHEQDPNTYDRLFNIKYRSDELHRNFNDKDTDTKMDRHKDSSKEEDSGTIVVQPCGHIHYYMPYVDSNKCCMCDKLIIES